MPEISQITIPITQNGQTTNVTYSLKDSTARSSSGASKVSTTSDGIVSQLPNTTGEFLKNTGIAGGSWTSISIADLPASSNKNTIGVIRTSGEAYMNGVYEPSADGDGTEISAGDTTSGKAQLGRSNFRWSRIYGVTINATNINGTNLDLTNPLPVTSGGTGCTSLADLKNSLNIESFSDPTLVDETTLDTIEGTSVFMGVNQPFGEQYDWVGIQIGSSEVSRSGDVFQLASVNTSDKQLLFRKNDLGEWNDWRRICFYDELPTIDSSLSSSSTNPVQNKVINTALGNKLDSSTVDSSGSSGSSGWYNCRISNGKIQYYNTDTTYTTTSSVTSGSSALVTSGGVYSALSSKVNSSSLGDAAYKNYTSSVTSGSSNLITSGAVYTALAACMQNLGNIGSANLNNYTSESGFFKFSGASNAPNGTTGGGIGIVWHSGTFSGMFVICYDSSSKKETCWARRYNGSKWTSWIQLGTL